MLGFAPDGMFALGEVDQMSEVAFPGMASFAVFRTALALSSVSTSAETEISVSNSGTASFSWELSATTSLEIV